MPAYNLKKKPNSFPFTYHQAFERVIGGKLGLTYTTYIGNEVGNRTKYWHSQHISAFKRALRNYPAHPLHEIVDKVKTRLYGKEIRENGDRVVQLWLEVTLYKPVSELLKDLSINFTE